MRFNDETLIQILQTMRTPGGKKLTNQQWRALLDTERSAEQPVVITGCRKSAPLLTCKQISL
jgi:hypothetical protein